MSNGNVLEEMIEEVQNEQITIEIEINNEIEAVTHETYSTTAEKIIGTIASLTDRSQRHQKIQDLVLRMRELGLVAPTQHNQKIKELRIKIDEEVRKQQAANVRKKVTIFESHDGMYCDTPNGPSQITNFIIYPNYRVYTDISSTNNRTATDTFAEFTIVVPQENDHAIHSIVELRSYDFRNAQALKEMLHKQNVGSAFIHGNDRMVSKLGEYLFTEVETEKKIGVNLIGIVEIGNEKVVVTPNNVYDLEGKIRSDIVYRRDSITPINVLSKLSGMDYEAKTWEQEVLPLFVQNVIHLHERSVMLCLLGWLAAIPFETIIRKKGNAEGFSHAILVGVNGGGKSAVAATSMPYFGYESSPTLPNFSTPYADLSALTMSYHVPVVRDEYRPSDWTEYERNTRNNLIRDSFGKKSSEKGQKSMDTISYPHRNPMLITGQMAPIDPSLIERMILIYLDGNFINEEMPTPEGRRAREVHDLLNNAPNKKFWTGFLIWCARQNSEEILTKWQQYTDRFKEMFPKLKIREAKNYAIVPMGLSFFKQLADEYGLDCGYEDEDIEQTIAILGSQVSRVLGEKKDELRLFFEDLDWYIGTHYNKNGNLVGDDFSVRLYQPSAGKADEYGKDKKPAFIRGRKVLLINIPNAVKTIEKYCKNKHNEQMLKPIITTEFEKTQKNSGDGLVLAPDGYRTPNNKRYTAFNWDMVKEYFGSLEHYEKAQSEFDKSIETLITSDDVSDKHGAPVQ